MFFEHASDCTNTRDERRDNDCDGRWIAQVDASTPGGKRRRRKRVAKSKRDAQRMLQQLRRESGVPAAVDGVTVGEWCQQWLEDCADRVRAGTLAPKTAAGYESDARLYIIPALGSIRLDKLQPGHVQRMLTGIQAKGLKPRTAAHARTSISAALGSAMADGLIEANVARAVRPPVVPATRASAFNDEEMGRIAEVCRTHPLGNAIVFDALTGLRTSELLGLKWDGVDIDEGLYRVEEGLHRIGPASADNLGIDAGLVASKPKNIRSGEATPLSPAAIEVLRRQRKQQAEQRLAAPKWHDSGRVFTMADGRPIDSSHLRRQFRKVLIAAKVPTHAADGHSRSLHELRRTFATRCRELGIGLEEVQRLGRWTSPAMLLNIYRAVDDQALRKAAGDSDGDIAW